jgi:hypothetical protein
VVFTGRRCFFYHWNSAFQRFFFQIMWFFHAKFPFFLIFSGICWPSWPGLSSEFLKSVSELPTTCYKRSIKSVSEVPNTKESMKPKKKHAREKNVVPKPPANPPSMCLLVHVWNASERYHNQVGNIKLAFYYGVANSAASINISCVTAGATRLPGLRQVAIVPIDGTCTFENAEVPGLSIWKWGENPPKLMVDHLAYSNIKAGLYSVFGPHFKAGRIDSVVLEWF